MAKLETFLGPFLDPDEKKRVAVPMVDYAVEFRKNQAYETGGNQIIGWELRVGDATASRSDTGEGLKGRWRYGDPIRVALRWAKDAKYLPAMAGAYGQVGGDGVTVTYDFGSPWSIVELLRAQASSPDDFETFFDPEPHTLRFVTGTRKARTKVRKGETPKVEQETKVFIRIALYSPEKQVPLTVPTFPERAPALMTTSAIERAIGGLR